MTTYKRLSFETLGGDDTDRSDRVIKGLSREATTPKFTIAFSDEGTRLHEYIDRNNLTASVFTRNELVAMIVNHYPVVELIKAKLSYVDNYSTILESVETKFLRDSDPVSVGTYS